MPKGEPLHTITLKVSAAQRAAYMRAKGKMALAEWCVRELDRAAVYSENV